VSHRREFDFARSRSVSPSGDCVSVSGIILSDCSEGSLMEYNREGGAADAVILTKCEADAKSFFGRLILRDYAYPRLRLASELSIEFSYLAPLK
jgi:hypothetical protein